MVGLLLVLLASPAIPIKLSQTPVTCRHAPPLQGEHTAGVLSDRLGMDTEVVKKLSDAGVIGRSPIAAITRRQRPPAQRAASSAAPLNPAMPANSGSTLPA